MFTQLSINYIFKGNSKEFHEKGYKLREVDNERNKSIFLCNMGIINKTDKDIERFVENLNKKIKIRRMYKK